MIGVGVLDEKTGIHVGRSRPFSIGATHDTVRSQADNLGFSSPPLGGV